MDNSKVKVGRLALRVEGDNWVAYYALSSTMDDAIWLGSIKMALVSENADRKHVFMSLMQDVVADFIEEQVGVRPVFDQPVSAPQHEHSGSA